MKIAFISDIHGNRIAFDILLNKLKSEKIDKIYFLGDAVGYFPDGNEIINGLIEHNIECILGNHDAMVLGHLDINETRDKIYLNKKQKQELTPKSIHILSKWVPFKEINLEKHRVLLTHGSPFNPLTGYIYPDTSFDIFNDLDYDKIIMGHTHRPFSIYHSSKYIINTGSVGLPRDFGNSASYVLWDTKNDLFSIKRIMLPVERIINNYLGINEAVKNVLRRNNI